MAEEIEMNLELEIMPPIYLGPCYPVFRRWKLRNHDVYATLDE